MCLPPAALCLTLATVILLVPAASAEEPQAAAAADMRIMERYIGEFRSPTHLFDDGKTKHHHLVKYQWFDRAKTIVKFTISMSIPSQDRVLTTAEGFYGYDSVARQLYVFGAFSHGTSGRGTICAFDHATGARTVCALSMEPDGSLTHVRDSFEIVDGDSWKNSTRIRKGDSADWQLVHEGVYRRVAD